MLNSICIFHRFCLSLSGGRHVFSHGCIKFAKFPSIYILFDLFLDDAILDASYERVNSWQGVFSSHSHAVSNKWCATVAMTLRSAPPSPAYAYNLQRDKQKLRLFIKIARCMKINAPNSLDASSMRHNAHSATSNKTCIAIDAHFAKVDYTNWSETHIP